ncbi:MAG: hypothetical protein HY921_02640 [Elusimicrobia bacterium]|nr:hypothetical protein [Elusimicrobiota bacterium]
MLEIFMAASLLAASPAVSRAQPAAQEPANDHRLKQLDILTLQAAQMVSSLGQFLGQAAASWEETNRKNRLQKSQPPVGAVPAPDLWSEARKNLALDCRARYSISFIQESGETRLLRNIGLESYYLCQAFIKKDQGGCRTAFKQVKAGVPDLERSCSSNWGALSLGHAIISKNPDAMRVCRTFIENDPIKETLRGAPTAKVCSLMLGPDGPESFCQKLSSMLLRPLGPQDVKACLTHRRMTLGYDKYCRQLDSSPKGAADLRLCQAVAAFRQAREARDPALCGAHEECRWMLAPSLESCEAAAKRAEAAYCSAWADESAMKQRAQLESQQRQQGVALLQKAPSEAAQRVDPNSLLMEQVKARRAEVENFLSQAQMAFEGFEPKSSTSYQARRQKFYQQRRRCERFLRDFAAKTTR